MYMTIITTMKTNEKTTYQDKILVDTSMRDAYKSAFQAKYPGCFILIKAENLPLEQDLYSIVPTEVRCYQKLVGTDLAPRLIHSEVLYSTHVYSKDDDDKDYALFFSSVEYVLVLEYGGTSLTRIHELTGSDIELDTHTDKNRSLEEWIDKYTDKISLFIPWRIRERVVEILYLLATKHGIWQLDIHMGNFLIDKHGTIRAIDFEYVDIDQ